MPESNEQATIVYVVLFADLLVGVAATTEAAERIILDDGLGEREFYEIQALPLAT